MARQLQRTIRASGASQRQVESALGWGKGYFSQLVKGNVDLKLRHVFRVLEHLDVEPATFFAEAFPPPPSKSRYESPSDPGSQVAEGGELRSLVTALVSREVDRRLGPGSTLPPRRTPPRRR